MAYSDHIARTWDRHILFGVLLELTYRCNLDCFICYNDRALQGQPLAKDDYFRLLDELADMQVMNLTLSGGEPLAHPDFWAIGRHARERGFVVRIKSNGHALNASIARRLKEEIAPFIIEISLHGATAATHDRQTRMTGSFAHLMDNLRALRAAGHRIKLNSPLTLWNEGEVEEMFALAEALGLRLSVDTRLTPRDDGDLTPLGIAASVDGIRKAMRTAEGLREAQPHPKHAPQVGSRHHCGAGSSTLAIDPMGNVYPCVQWRRSIGNLHADRIQDLWQSGSKLGWVRSATEQVKRQLARLDDGGRSLGFCPALAEQRTGSPLRFDPEIRRRIQALAKAT